MELDATMRISKELLTAFLVAIVTIGVVILGKSCVNTDTCLNTGHKPDACARL